MHTFSMKLVLMRMNHYTAHNRNMSCFFVFCYQVTELAETNKSLEDVNTTLNKIIERYVYELNVYMLMLTSCNVLIYTAMKC